MLIINKYVNFFSKSIFSMSIHKNDRIKTAIKAQLLFFVWKHFPTEKKNICLFIYIFLLYTKRVLCFVQLSNAVHVFRLKMPTVCIHFQWDSYSSHIWFTHFQCGAHAHRHIALEAKCIYMLVDNKTQYCCTLDTSHVQCVGVCLETKSLNKTVFLVFLL